jgi:hypothetical protein
MLRGNTMNADVHARALGMLVSDILAILAKTNRSEVEAALAAAESQPVPPTMVSNSPNANIQAQAMTVRIDALRAVLR